MSEMFDKAYLALPPTQDPAPAILLIHAWWGLNDFFKQLADRLAKEGFVVLAPDLYRGRVAQTIEEAQALLEQMKGDGSERMAVLHRSIEALKKHPRSNGQGLGVMGFSLGAYYNLMLLKSAPEAIKASVLFYGTGERDFSKLSVPVMAHFAENDDFEPQEEVVALEEALKASGAKTSFHTYPNTGHWFFESDRPDAYNSEAAELAWQRTIDFLRQEL